MTADQVSVSQNIHRVLISGWSEPTNVSQSTTATSVTPVVLSEEPGVTHIIWEENERIYYRRDVKGEWSGTKRLGHGRQPAAVVGPDGTLYILYVNDYQGNINVFFVRLENEVWSLPRLVSRTIGQSDSPAVVVDHQGQLHAAWVDRTPGYPVIYHARLEEAWLYGPIPNARGTAPVLVSDRANGVLHVAWQSQNINEDLHEIYHAQGQTYSWTLPENISASPQQDSRDVAMVSDAEGTTHLVWQELSSDRGSELRYAGGRQGHWSVPETISAAGKNAADPAVVVTHGNQLSVVWREVSKIVYRRRSGNDNRWRPSQDLLENSGLLENVTMSADAEGRFLIAWDASVGSDLTDVFQSTGEAALTAQVYMPMASVGH